MRKGLALLLVIALFFMPTISRAQEKPKLSSLEVDLWPEYDNPAMLVIYRIMLSSSVTLPANLAIRIPTEAGRPNAVAIRQLDGQLADWAHEQETGGDWITVRLTAPLPEIQIEYYDPRLIKQGSARTFEYFWPGDYAVDALSIQVQQPIEASGMRISPSLGSGRISDDGLTYYTAEVGSLADGESFKISLDYQKTSSTLSAEKVQVRPSQSISQDAFSLSALMQNMRPYVLPLALGLVGIALIVGGGIWYFRTGRKGEVPERRRRHGSSYTSEEADHDGAIYCHQCGKRAGPGDRFCRSCGTRLRRAESE
jgi:hypothetical protein